jgi:hypothetical protein
MNLIEYIDNPLITKLVNLKLKSPSSFRLSVHTPDDVQEEGFGQYQAEAHVILRLLNTAYSEVVFSMIADVATPVADRGRNPQFNPETPGAYESEAEQSQNQESLVEQAMHRAQVILAYGWYISRITHGGAEWLQGFTINNWGAADPNDEEAVLACSSDADITTFIKESRVILKREQVQCRLLHFNDWCQQQLKREGLSPEWRAKVAYATTVGYIEDQEAVSHSIMKEFIGPIVAEPAFNRPTSRLEDAVTQAANTQYLKLLQAFETGKENKVWDKEAVQLLIPYSPILKANIQELKASTEWHDQILQEEVTTAHQAAEKNLREALREQVLSTIAQQANQVANINAKAEAIRATLRGEATLPTIQ